MGTVPSIAPMVKKDIKKLGAAQQVWGWGWGGEMPQDGYRIGDLGT